jgi:hypothetical protein
MRCLLILVLLLLGACASPMTIRLNDDGERRLTDADSIDVALDPGDEGRVERIGRTSTSAFTGPVWKKAFAGNTETSTASLHVLSSTLKESLAGAGFTVRYRYKAEALLRIGSRQIELRGEGTRAASAEARSALRQAVELCILDIARQARLALANVASEPNQPLEPMARSVTPRADARVAPAPAMAHH